MDRTLCATIHGTSAQTVDPHFVQHRVRRNKLKGHAGRNRGEGLRSAAQGDVRDSYLELGILHCSLWGKCLHDRVGPGTIHGLSWIHGLRIYLAPTFADFRREWLQHHVHTKCSTVSSIYSISQKVSGSKENSVDRPRSSSAGQELT